MKELSFVSMNDFQSWKEREEEATYTTYVKSQQTYHPSFEGVFFANDLINTGMHNVTSLVAEISNRYYFVCCRDGIYTK